MENNAATAVVKAGGTSKWKESAMRILFLACACVSICAVALICIFLFAKAFDFFACCVNPFTHIHKCLTHNLIGVCRTSYDSRYIIKFFLNAFGYFFILVYKLYC